MSDYFRLYLRDEYERSGRKSYLAKDYESFTEYEHRALVTNDIDFWGEDDERLAVEYLPEDQQMARSKQPRLFE